MASCGMNNIPQLAYCPGKKFLKKGLTKLKFSAIITIEIRKEIKKMRPTGIVRRIDDLGRVCIPKEIRKMTHIQDGDPFEIFIEDQNIILKLYDPIGNQKIERKMFEVIDELSLLNEYELKHEAEQLLKKIHKKTL